MMNTVKHAVTVHAPAQACYDWWRPLTRLPEIFSDVRSVEPLEGERTSWTIDGPAAVPVRWEAEVAEDSPPHTLAWRTVDAGIAEMTQSGVVEFHDRRNGYTDVEVQLEYDLPAGKAGEAVAKRFDDPQHKVEQACEEFETIIEQR